MAAEFVAHRRQKPIAKLCSRVNETARKGCGKDIRWHGSSTAASMVQRPSPESSTAPRKLVR